MMPRTRKEVADLLTDAAAALDERGKTYLSCAAIYQEDYHDYAVRMQALRLLRYVMHPSDDEREHRGHINSPVYWLRLKDTTLTEDGNGIKEYCIVEDDEWFNVRVIALLLLAEMCLNMTEWEFCKLVRTLPNDS